jgi:hypothetical protein
MHAQPSKDRRASRPPATEFRRRVLVLRSDQPACGFGRRLRMVISALSCSIIRARSALGRARYFVSSSASALSNERRPFIALSIRSTIRRRAGSGDAGDRDFPRRDRFGKLRLARKRPRRGGLVSVFFGPGYLGGVGHGSNRCILFCSATAALQARFQYCDSPSHLLPNRNTCWVGDAGGSRSQPDGCSDCAVL